MSTKRATALARYGATLRKKRSYRKKYPTRLTGSRLNYKIAKQVDKAMSRVTETKVLPMTKINEWNPTPIQTLAQAYTSQFCFGSIPAVWSGTRGLSSITNFQIPPADREGDYVYLNKSSLTVEVDMNQGVAGKGLCEFRVICFKSIRADTPVGISHAYKDDLFLDIDGGYFGHETPGVNGTDLMVQPVNKKFWHVLSDERFTLSPSNDGAVNNSNSSYYGSHRTMKFSVPWYKKVSFDNLLNTPDNIDYRYVFAIFARPVGKDNAGDSWELNIRGLTTYKDN